MSKNELAKLPVTALPVMTNNLLVSKTRAPHQAIMCEGIKTQAGLWKLDYQISHSPISYQQTLDSRISVLNNTIGSDSENEFRRIRLIEYLQGLRSNSDILIDSEDVKSPSRMMAYYRGLNEMWNVTPNTAFNDDYFIVNDSEIVKYPFLKKKSLVPGPNQPILVLPSRKGNQKFPYSVLPSELNIKGSYDPVEFEINMASYLNREQSRLKPKIERAPTEMKTLIIADNKSFTPFEIKFVRPLYTSNRLDISYYSPFYGMWSVLTVGKTGSTNWDQLNVRFAGQSTNLDRQWVILPNRSLDYKEDSVDQDYVTSNNLSMDSVVSLTPNGAGTALICGVVVPTTNNITGSSISYNGTTEEMTVTLNFGPTTYSFVLALTVNYSLQETWYYAI